MENSFDYHYNGLVEQLATGFIALLEQVHELKLHPDFIGDTIEV